MNTVLATDYIPTTDIATALALIEFHITADVPAFLWGKPGLGKSDGINGFKNSTALRAYFESIGMAQGAPICVHDWRANLRDPVDARGLPVPDMADGTTKWLMPSDLPFIGNDRFPEFGVLFLEELLTASQAMQVCGFQLVLDRAIGEHKLKAGWRIVACGNNLTDKAGVQRAPTPLMNRFAHVRAVENVAAWCAWANKAGIDPCVIAFIRFRETLLHVMPGQTVDATTPITIPQDSPAFPTPRAYASVSKVVKHVRTLPAATAKAMLPIAVASLIGKGPAAEFCGFFDMFHNAPRPADIIANPDSVAVPVEPGILYAITGALARKADAINLAPIVRYTNRCGSAWTARLMADAIGRDESLKQTAAYTQWAVDNQINAL